MSMVEINWKPTDRQLRQFGLASLVAFPLLGWLFSGRPWPAAATQTQVTIVAALAALGLVLAVMGLVKAQSLRPVFIGMTLLALPIGLVVSELILIILYYLLFTPLALLFRLIGRDALERGIDRNAKSYWQSKRKPQGVESYFRQS